MKRINNLKMKPETVTVGGVTAKISRSDVGGHESWLIRYYLDGKRKALRATTLMGAKKKAKDALSDVASGVAHVKGRAFTPKETANIEAAIAKLQSVNAPPLLAVISDYCEAWKILGPKWTAAEAARAFVEMKANEAEATKPVIFREVVERFHERNERLGLSDLHKRDCRKHLEIISKCIGNAVIQSLRKPELTLCLEEVTKSSGARRFNNLRCTLNSLFGFAKKEGILPRDRTHEAALIEKKIDKHSEAITIYTPAEMRLVLENIGEELLPWALLGGFAGLRVAEIHRLRWESIRLDAGVMTLDKTLTKTKRRRVIHIGDALRAWITPLHKGKGLIYEIPYKTYEDRLHKGWCKMLGDDGKPLVEKRKNALRHSYGTYRFAILKNEFQVSAEMGNSPNELRASYAELALPKDADAWFAIMPEQTAKVIPMKGAAA